MKRVFNTQPRMSFLRPGLEGLTGFDDEADALFVTEQLRAQLFDASERLADKVTGDPTALARLLPQNAPTDATGRATAFIAPFGQRAFRRPLTGLLRATLARGHGAP